MAEGGLLLASSTPMQTRGDSLRSPGTGEVLRVAFCSISPPGSPEVILADGGLDFSHVALALFPTMDQRDSDDDVGLTARGARN